MPELDWTAALTAAEIVRCGCRRPGLAMSASACGNAQADPASVGMANASQPRSISAAGTLVLRRAAPARRLWWPRTIAGPIPLLASLHGQVLHGRRPCHPLNDRAPVSTRTAIVGGAHLIAMGCRAGHWAAALCRENGSKAKPGQPLTSPCLTRTHPEAVQPGAPVGRSRTCGACKRNTWTGPASTMTTAKSADKLAAEQGSGQGGISNAARTETGPGSSA